MINSIFQDEPTDGDGDANGRVYQISFTADDGNGDQYSDTVLVSVPHDKKSDAVDDGAIFDSTIN